jgi:glycine cleavage system aminomethyltransferase T
VYAVTGRIEKGYRLMGAELESEYNPVEAGLARTKVKAADFIGKEAYLAARNVAPAAILCTLSMLDHTSAEASSAAIGGNGDHADGDRIVDARRTSRVATASAHRR